MIELKLDGFELPDPQWYRQYQAVIYTDGSCAATDRVGGWAWCSLNKYGTVLHKQSGAKRDVTISMMELAAIGMALSSHSNADRRVLILSDSQYAVNACTKWAPKWRKNGWRTAEDKPVAHAQLIDTINRLILTSNSDLRWVRGHQNTWGNIQADMLAGQARAELLKREWDDIYRGEEEVELGRYNGGPLL